MDCLGTVQTVAELWSRRLGCVLDYGPDSESGPFFGAYEADSTQRVPSHQRPAKKGQKAPEGWRSPRPGGFSTRAEQLWVRTSKPPNSSAFSPARKR
jgi:hypothetical protein